MLCDKEARRSYQTVPPSRRSPMTRRGRLRSTFLKFAAASLATLGRASPVVVTDSAGVAIDAGFTYEIVNDTCNEDPSDD